MLIKVFDIFNLSNSMVTKSERLKVADHIAHKSRARNMDKFQ